MSLLNVLILAVVQGLAELLPISSSAHVVVAEKLMGLDPSSPPMTLLLVMLHTGTMFAVLVYFWGRWKSTYFSSAEAFKVFAGQAVAATVVTGVIGEAIIKVIEKTAFRGLPNAEIEDLFSHLELVAPALAAAGILIVIAGLYERRKGDSGDGELTMRQSLWIGFVQGFCLPFRGFSRSGATISTGMLAGAAKERAENFSFALAVILTPIAIAREALRLVRMEHITGIDALKTPVLPSLIGALFAFVAGLAALKWLSAWLEGGRWQLFGYYCLGAAALVEMLHLAGY